MLAASAHAFPKPSPYPISWELKFDYSTPKRIVVRPKGADAPQAYWYMTFTVTNNSGEERKFLPRFEMITNDGEVLRSDNKIPQDIIESIRQAERNRHLEPVHALAGTLRIGEDQAREGVAIWKEPDPKMGRFSIFVTGLSGEAVILTGKDGKPEEKTDADGKKSPVILFKTLRIDYHVPGDEKFPGNDVVDLAGQEWVMR
jgi:hypothetical protein